MVGTQLCIGFAQILEVHFSFGYSVGSNIISNIIYEHETPHNNLVAILEYQKNTRMAGWKSSIKLMPNAWPWNGPQSCMVFIA